MAHYYSWTGLPRARKSTLWKQCGIILTAKAIKSSQEPKKSFESFKMQPSRNSDGFNILGSFSTSDFFLFLVIHENIFFIYSCKFTWINLPLGWKNRFRKQLEIGDDFPRWLAVQLISIDFIITNYNRLNHCSPHAGRGKYTPLCVLVLCLGHTAWMSAR